MNEIAIAVKEQLEKDIPELRVTADDLGVGGHYYCPCGEMSRIHQLIFPQSILNASFYVEEIKKKLREHVRKEGYEPNF